MLVNEAESLLVHTYIMYKLMLILSPHLYLVASLLGGRALRAPRSAPSSLRSSISSLRSSAQLACLLSGQGQVAPRGGRVGVRHAEMINQGSLLFCCGGSPGPRSCARASARAVERQRATRVRKPEQGCTIWGFPTDVNQLTPKGTISSLWLSQLYN